MDIIQQLATFRRQLTALAMIAEHAGDRALDARIEWETEDRRRGDDYSSARASAAALSADKAEHEAAVAKQSLRDIERALAEWAYGLPWGASNHGRVFVQRWSHWPLSSGCTTQINVDGFPVYNTSEGFISREEGLRRKAAKKAANKAANAAYAEAMEASVAAVRAGIALAYSCGQQGGTFTGPAGRVSASGLCRATGKSVEEIEEGELRTRLPASRKARNDWRSQECPDEYVLEYV